MSGSTPGLKLTAIIAKFLTPNLITHRTMKIRSMRSEVLKAVRGGIRGAFGRGNTGFPCLESAASSIPSRVWRLQQESKASLFVGQRPRQIAVEKRRQIIWKLTPL